MYGVQQIQIQEVQAWRQNKMAIELIDKIAPKNDGFVGMLDADQVIGGGASGTLPDAAVAASNVT